jgi:exopolysaccharide biosynthesis polyprenyl glycosylphosphotransferase
LRDRGEESGLVRRHAALLRMALMAVDVLSAVALFATVSEFRLGEDWRAEYRAVGLNPAIAAAVYGAGWLFVMWLQGMYRLRARWSLRTDIVALLRATAMLLLATLLVLVLLRLSDGARFILITLFSAQAALAIASRVVLRRLFGFLRSRGHITRYMLIAGAGDSAQDFADRVERHPDLGLRVIGHLASTDDVGLPPRRPVLGTLDDVETILHSRVVDEVAICLPVSQWDLAEPIARLCESEGKFVRIPGHGPTVTGGYMEEFDGLNVQSLVYGPDRALGLLAKRLMDISVAAAGLVVLSPLLAGIGLWIWRAEGRPVMFRQERVGEHGRRFTLLKFRTMARDAEERLAELAAINEISGRAFKVTDDPRLTRSGRLLRRTSLDELPQLWNVLRGEMSLVGPRPPLPREVEGYDVWHRRRLSMRPGMTGLWQVSARREPDFDRWVNVDLEYIDRWSLWLDFKIMLRTVPAVLGQEGR